MKIWSNPEVEELNLSNTNYGGTTTKEFDDIFVNAEGNWEGTFKEDIS